MSIALRLELHADRRARRRRVGEEQADRRLHRFALCTRDHVEQQDEVGAGIERPRVVGRLHHRHLARRPAVHVLHLTAVHRRETGTRVGTIERARHAPEIDRQVRVVQHLWAIGAELDGAHVARRGDRHRNDEVAEHVAASRAAARTPPAASARDRACQAAIRRKTSAASARRPDSPRARRSRPTSR